MHDPTAALREAYGGTPDTSTLKGLLHYLRLWLQDDDSAPTHELMLGFQDMAGTLARAQLDTEADLERNAQLDDSLADPIRDSLDSYNELHRIVTELAAAVEHEDREEGHALLSQLEETAERLDEAQKSMAHWLEQPVLRCPACGASGTDPCPNCSLELVYPDRGDDASQQTATLPQQYGPVYQAYQSVLQAEKSLSAITAPLAQLETHLRNLIAMGNASLRESKDSQTLTRLLANLEESLEGAGQMRESLRTRQMKELRRGWTRVFEAALEHDRIRAEVVLEFGGEEEKALLESLSPELTDDSIVLSGE